MKEIAHQYADLNYQETEVEDILWNLKIKFDFPKESQYEVVWAADVTLLRLGSDLRTLKTSNNRKKR